ncbi:MAG: hypothetical protein U0522_01760 [Candidatus Paceibacterota bacterium]
MSDQKINLYCFDRLPGMTWIPFLDWVFGPRKTNELFQNKDPYLYAGLFNLIDDPENADYFLVPHLWSFIKNKESYLKKICSISSKYNKTMILFAYQDSAEQINIPNTIIFRSSQYKSKLAKNEIIMPAFVEDLGALYGVSFKKRSDKPSVGFVGKAGFESFTHWIKFFIKNVFLLNGPYKNGIYFRLRSMGILKKHSGVFTNFICRSSFSGNLKTIPLDPETARREYVENITQNDFTLSVRGDGNFSLRFYEALSLGRIPLFLDTDCVLPLEDEIFYDDFLLRVDYRDIENLGNELVHSYGLWSEEEYLIRQKRAREIFEKYLYMPVFIKHTFSREFLSRYESKNK